MKQIYATLGYVALVDDADFDSLSEFRWYAHNNSHGDKRPARRTSVAEGRKVKFLVHHIISCPAGMVVDHRNGDPWDNRRSNLRICTHAENLRNRRKHRGCKNPAKGVHVHGARFDALITFEGKNYRLGRYDTVEAAALAYDAAALYLHGEFARLNFPERGTAPKSPEDLRAARRPEPAATLVDATAIERLRAGETASSVARSYRVSTTTVCRWAARHGVALTCGRPRLYPADEPARAA